MFKLLKKHFIPHKGNNHRPHFLHGSNAFKIVLLALFLELTLFTLPSLALFYGPNFLASVLPSVLNNLTNDKRVSAHLNQLNTNLLLEQAAAKKAGDMASKGYFAHTSPEGVTPWYWLSSSGYFYTMAGENLAVNFTDSKDVTEAWMNSPTHRDNILKQGFTEIGTAAATGYYNGHEAVFVVQYYAAPSMIAFASTTVPANIVSTSTPSVVTATASATTAVLGEAINTLSTSPRRNTNIALLGILGIVILALSINLITKVRVKHPDLITNGLIVTVIVFGIYLSNNYLFSNHPVVPTGSAQVSEITINTNNI